MKCKFRCKCGNNEFEKTDNGLPFPHHSKGFICTNCDRQYSEFDVFKSEGK